MRRNNVQRKKFIIPASHDGQPLELDLTWNSYEKADFQCNEYIIENQINGICSIEFVENKNQRWQIFGIQNRNMKTVQPNRLIDACTNLNNLVKGKEVLLYSKYGPMATIERKIRDNEPLEIFFMDELLKDKNYHYPLEATFKLTCGEFKEILMIPTYEIFYEPNKNLITRSDELAKHGVKIDDYRNNMLIHEFKPDADIDMPSDPHFEEPTESGIPSLFKLFMERSFVLYDSADKDEETKAINLAHDILIAKIDFWKKIKSIMFDYTHRMELEGAYFNVNNIWHNRDNKTETSKTWDIIDSIGIMMMRLLPLLFIILLIVIIIMIVKINKNKYGCNK